MFNLYSKLWWNDEITGCWLWKVENECCHWCHMICCNIKRAEGSKSLSRILTKTFQIQWRTGVCTLNVGSGSVLRVSSRSAALHRRPCHSHRDVFVLLREAIQAAAQSRDSSSAPVLNEGPAVFPLPSQTPHPSCARSPSHPSLPFPLFSPKTKGVCPHNSQYSHIRTSMPFSLISILYSSSGDSI